MIGTAGGRAGPSKYLRAFSGVSSPHTFLPSPTTPTLHRRHLSFTSHPPPPPPHATSSLSAKATATTMATALSSIPVSIVDPNTGLPIPDAAAEKTGSFLQPFTDHVIQPLAEVLLASPLPSFGLTIMIATFLLRAGITLPVTIWQRKRMMLDKNIVETMVTAYVRQIAGPIARRTRAEGHGDKEFKQEMKKRVRSAAHLPTR